MNDGVPKEWLEAAELKVTEPTRIRNQLNGSVNFLNVGKKQVPPDTYCQKLIKFFLDDPETELEPESDDNPERVGSRNRIRPLLWK